MLPEAFPPLPPDLVQVGESLVASSLLSPRFIRGLGRLELLSCGKLLLLFMSDWLSLLVSVRLTR